MTIYQRPNKRAIDWPLGLLSAALLVVLYAAIARVDDNAFDADALARQEQVRLAAEHESAEQVARAYEQGQRDALDGFARSSKGVALAQTCMAWWYGGNVDKSTMRQKVCRGVAQ